MKRLFYPAVFHKAEEGGYWITFPNFPDTFTEGDTLEECYSMAVDALGLTLADLIEAKAPLPTPFAIEDIPNEKDAYPVMIEFDYFAYRKKHNGRAVKKTLSIPQWLNEEALALGLNFSQVLQEALLAKIDQ